MLVQHRPSDKCLIHSTTKPRSILEERMSSFPFAHLDNLSQSIRQEIKPSLGAPLVNRVFAFRSISRKDTGWLVQVLGMDSEGDNLICWEGGYPVGKSLDELLKKIPDYTAAAFSERVASLIRAGYLHFDGLDISKGNAFELHISDPQKKFKDCVINLDRKVLGVPSIAFDFLVNTMCLLSESRSTPCSNSCAPDILTKPMVHSSPTSDIPSIPTSPTQYKILKEELARSRATIAKYQQSIAESSSMTASSGLAQRASKPLKRAQQLVAHPHSKRSRVLPPPSSSSSKRNPSSKSSERAVQPFDTDTSEDTDVEIDNLRCTSSLRRRALRVKKEEDENLLLIASTSRSHRSKLSRTIPKTDCSAFDPAGLSADDSDTVFGNLVKASNKTLTPSVKRPNFDETKRTKSMECRKIKPGASDESCTEDSESEQTIPTSSLLISTQTSDVDSPLMIQT